VDCQDVESRLHAYLEEEVPRQEDGQIRAHLSLCGRCRAQAARIEGRALLVYPALPEAVGRDLEEEILEIVQRGPRRRKRIRQASIAGTIVVALAAILIYWSGRGDPTRTPRITSPGPRTGMPRDGTGPAAPGIDIVGRVMTRSRPVPFARIEVSFLDGEPAPESWNTSTDENGRFRIAGVDREIFIEIRRPGYLPADVTLPDIRAWIEEGRRTHQADVNLVRGGVAGGAVVDEGGFPVAGARVQIRAVSGVPLEFRRTVPAGGGAEVRTGEDGSFRILSAPVDTPFRLIAIHPDHALHLGPEDRILAPARELRVDIVLSPGGRVAGRVEDASGRPWTGATVRALSPETGEPHLLWDRTGSDGRFQIPHLPLGRWDLQIREGDEILWDGDVHLTPEDRDRDISVRIEGGEPPTEGVLLCRGLDLQGEPLTGVEAHAWGEDFDLKGQADASGNLRLKGPGGVWSVEVTAPERTIVLWERVVVPLGGETDLGEVYLAPEHRLEGRVTEPTGRSIQGATLQVFTLDGEAVSLRGEDLWSRITEIGTDFDGSFALQGLEPGEYYLLARHGQYAPAGATFSAAASAPALAVTLSPAPERVIQIIDGAGEPTPVLSLRIYQEEGLPLWASDVESTEYTLRLGAGSYGTLCEMPDGGEAIVTIQVPAGDDGTEPVRLQLP
jgi:hypothetical protein